MTGRLHIRSIDGTDFRVKRVLLRVYINSHVYRAAGKIMDDNRIRLAATVDYGGVRAVLSATVRVELAPERLLLHVESLRAGLLPVPRGQLLELARTNLEGRGDTSVTITEGTITLRNEWTWPNGKPRLRIARLETAAGVCRVSLEPVGR